MERGRENEAVFEYTPELSTAPQRTVGGAKGAVSISTRVTPGASALRENENIDTSTVNVSKALDLFSTREADAFAAAAEAAAAAAPARSGPGHSLQQLLASTGGSAAEPADQRYARLHVEIAALLRIAEQSPPDVAADLLGRDAEGMAGELKALERKLKVWRKSMGARAARVSGLGAMSSTLVDQLDRLTLKSAPAGPDSAGQGADADCVIWEVNYAPSTEAIADGSKLSMLESTIHAIEKKMGTFEASASNVDLQSAMTSLHKRLCLLDLQKLEVIRSNAEKAKGSIQACLDKKEEIAAASEPSANGAVRQLHGDVHHLVPEAAALPSIVMRLQSLQALHQQSASFTSRLSAVEHQQTELRKVLEATNTAVREMQVGLNVNMQIMQDNMAALEEKLASKT